MLLWKHTVLHFSSKINKEFRTKHGNVNIFELKIWKQVIFGAHKTLHFSPLFARLNVMIVLWDDTWTKVLILQQCLRVKTITAFNLSILSSILLVIQEH